MGVNSKIEWCDATINFWMGCEPVSEGCRNCYARRFWACHHLGPGERRRVKRATICGIVRRCKAGSRVFVNSLSDFFDPAVPHEYRGLAWEVFDARRDLTFLLLTKRPSEIEPVIAATCPHRIEHGWPHVWLGVTAENQKHWNKRVGELMRIDWPGKRFVSLEPLLGEIDVDFCDAGQALGPCDQCGQRGANPDCQACAGLASIDWVIAGGESGAGARPCNPEWLRSVRDQCNQAGVPFFFKQWGAYMPAVADLDADECGYRCGPTFIDSEGRDVTAADDWYQRCSAEVWRVGKKAAGRVLDGRTWEEMPETASATEARRTRRKG